jgi:DNA primase
VIPQQFIQDLLARADIVEIVGRQVALKKAGINHKGLCPFHGEKSPSFIVSPSRQTYHCFGCGAHGNAVGFLMEMAGLSFVEAVKDLAQQLGMSVPEEELSAQERQQAAQKKKQQAGLTDTLGRAADHYRAQLKHYTPAVDYLKRRGLSGEIAARFGLGYAPAGWRFLSTVFPRYDDPALEESGLVIRPDPEPGAELQDKRYDRFRDRIMFPIRNVAGEVIGFGGRVLDQGEPKYLNSPETPVFSKGKELYGLHEARTTIRQKGYVLVVEGYMDVVALTQMGFGNAVATLGTACTADHVHKLFRFSDSVVFSFDGDAAGRRAATRALEAALPHASDNRTIRFLFLPPEHDPDSFVREHGQEAFEAEIERAVPLSRQLLETARDAKDMSTAEGRAQFLKSAQPLWSLLPEGGLKQQIQLDLARAGGLGIDDLRSLWAATPKPRQQPNRSARLDSQDDTPPWARTPGMTEAESPPQSQSGEDAPWFEAPPRRPADRTGRLDRATWTSRETRGGAKPWSRDSAARAPWRAGQEIDAMQPPLRKRPARPADQILRLLLTHSHWLESLSPQDLALLQRLPTAHREICVWLEREVLDHGAQPWAVIEAALQPLGLLQQVPQSIPDPAAPEQPELSDLRRLLDGLRLQELAERQQALLTRLDAEPTLLSEYRELEQQRLLLLAAMNRSGEGPS